MKLSLGQAAKLAGRGKTTLTRAIKAGRLSAARAEGGGYLIDVSELARVYELRHDATPETVTRDRHAVHRATPHATVARDPLNSETASRLAELETEVRLLREMLAEVRENRDEMRAERDDWRNRAERLLTDQRAPTAASPAPRRHPPRPRLPAASESAATADATPSPSGFIQREEFDVENGMEKIRRRLEARLAARGH